MHAIITGATKGIGAALTVELENKGHDWTGLSASCGQDITDPQLVKEIFTGFYNEKNIPNLLINNAAVVELGSVIELSIEAWRRQFEVNLHGIFYCCKEFIKMVKHRGIEARIINVASTSGLLVPRPGRSAYAASKAALISFSLSLAEEVRADGIKVYCIAPGACNTDLRKQIYPDDDFDNMMQPEELARFIVNIAENGNMLDNQVILAKGN